MRNKVVPSYRRHVNDNCEPELQWLEDAINMTIGYTIYCIKALFQNIWRAVVRKNR